MMPAPRSALALLLLLASTRLIAGQAVDSLPQCAKTCVNNELGNPALGCGASGKDLPCLCANPNFGFGVRDCANAACPPDVAKQAIAAASALCAAATPSSNSALAATTRAPTTNAAQPLPPPATAPPTAPTAPPAAPTPPAAMSTNTETESLILAPSASSPPAGSAYPSQAWANRPATASAGNAATAGNTNGASTTAASLSTSVKAGIGVGAGAAGAALIGVAVFAVARRRRTRNSGLPMDNGPPPPPPEYRGGEKLKAQISDPLQGSGQSFAHDLHYNRYETGLSELEVRSRRYEDMLPRTSPKHLV